MTNKPYPLGKLPAAHLARLLGQHTIEDPRVIVGPRVGQDVAVLELGERYLVAKSDPITFATDAIGWYAVHVNANDVACSGASPRWFLATLLLPEGRADAALVDDIMHQITCACQEIGASLVGGHTEITYGLQRPIVIGSMLGEVPPERLVTTSGARPGDALLLTRRVAVEATAIIAQEKRDELLEQHGLTSAYVDRCANFIHDPGISVVRAAQIAASVAPIHAMHDPTEGGLASGLWELASAAGVGLEIDSQAIPIYPETRALCEVYGLDPRGVIASGSLLLTLAFRDAGPVCAALGEAGIETSVIGRVLPPGSGVRTSEGQSLPSFARDEIARLFE